MSHLPRLDKIVTHEDYTLEGPYLNLIGECFRRRYLGGLPPLNQQHGIVQAFVNAGRWVAMCPNAPKCHGTVRVAEFMAVFICPACGSPENKGRWYVVEFPPDRAEIETILLARPTDPMTRSAKYRNWQPGESTAFLRLENEIFAHRRLAATARHSHVRTEASRE